jgi:hypothetical protein
MPVWIRGDVLDVRYTVLQWMNSGSGSATNIPATHVWLAHRRKNLYLILILLIDVERHDAAVLEYTCAVKGTRFTGIRRSTTQWHRRQ